MDMNLRCVELLCIFNTILIHHFANITFIVNTSIYLTPNLIHINIKYYQCSFNSVICSSVTVISNRFEGHCSYSVVSFILEK